MKTKTVNISNIQSSSNHKSFSETNTAIHVDTNHQVSYASKLTMNDTVIFNQLSGINSKLSGSSGNIIMKEKSQSFDPVIALKGGRKLLVSVSKKTPITALFSS